MHLYYVKKYIDFPLFFLLCLIIIENVQIAHVNVHSHVFYVAISVHTYFNMPNAYLEDKIVKRAFVYYVTL